ncbi:lantibiotic dehydratase [Streptomyces sp. NPDC058657]|uniref:lantibiotic dehydratase n=1 Tax=unclassified Streptomyces TaxID=2593676 RepID=UPI003663C2E6
MAHGSPITYRWQPGVLLRASTAAQHRPMPDLDLHGDDVHIRGRQWLAEVWGDPVPEAVSAASPALCQRVTKILNGTVTDARPIRRAVQSVAAYLLRWNHRPTPFGVFAGVAPVLPARTAWVAWGEGYRTILRADSDWLTDVITRLEASPALLARLTVMVNNTGRSRGNRHVVEGEPSGPEARGFAPVEVSVRNTRPVAAVLAAARSPIAYGVLLNNLAEQFPSAHHDQLNRLLTNLLSEHVLLSSLWPPMVTVDTLAHVCLQLDKADAAHIPDIADLATQLTDLHARMDHPTGPTPWAPGSALVQDMQRLSTAGRVPLLIDTALDCTLDVPESLLDDAAEAAQVMHHLSPHPYGYPQWRDYHQRFLDRYGAGAEVPVTELVADSGLGMPSGFLGSERTRAPYQATGRDEKILRLLQEAMLDGSRELVLTRARIADLTADLAEPPLPVPRAEIAVEVHAPTLEAVQRGDYRLWVTGAPRPGSSMLGRFAHLLAPAEQSALTSSYATTSPGALPAQLSFTPRRRRNENVSRTAQILPHTIPLGEHHEPGPDVIEVDDLAVTADERRFFLVRLSTGQHIEPRVAHALEASVHTPPLARFLAEVATARSAAYKSFTFGVAATLPYLPRVRYKRTILAPARWLLSADELPTPSAPMADWDTVLDRWRERLRVPDRVALVENDQQLHIDFGRHIPRALLRSCLDRTGLVELREAGTEQDRAWIGRPHQLLIPLANAAPPATSPRSVIPTLVIRPTPDQPSVLCARLYTHPQRHDEILTAHLPHLLGQFEDLPRWWFSRYRNAFRPDGDQHLVLYLSLPAGGFGEASERVDGWAASLHHQRLIARLETASYQPQTGLYGHGPALEAAHAVFAADAVAAVSQIRATGEDSITRQALAAASMVDLAVQFFHDRDRAADWLTRTLPREHGRLARELSRPALALADPAQGALRALPGGPEITAAWEHRSLALRDYRNALAEQGNPSPVPRSLLHQHHLRALPADPDRERTTYRLARNCALHHQERRP